MGADSFRTRSMLRPVVCARGADAARLVHDSQPFTRRLLSREAEKFFLPLFRKEWSQALRDRAAQGRIVLFAQGNLVPWTIRNGWRGICLR